MIYHTALQGGCKHRVAFIEILLQLEAAMPR